MPGNGNTRLPDRWTDYLPLGQRMPGTRFIAFKVPLKKSFEWRLAPKDRFSPFDLLKKVREQKEELGMIIDLTYTTRYYGPEELPKTLCYSKILTVGHEVPDNETIFKFKCAVKEFLWENRDNDKLIGVHCTHGLNRTGYLVCRYLIDVEGMEPNVAIELFNRSRGHSIERQNYIEDLQKGPIRMNHAADGLAFDLIKGQSSTAPNLDFQVVGHHPYSQQLPLADGRLFPSWQGKGRKREQRALYPVRNFHGVYDNGRSACFKECVPTANLAQQTPPYHLGPVNYPVPLPYNKQYNYNGPYFPVQNPHYIQREMYKMKTSSRPKRNHYTN
ncbi:RNA/RNP complex-1-interacting phosphatase [Trachemys scripta elegans]|uniref:RNA/RNP complex-1-interacting phosphatase n=1 Tax=Trachemys scripta elegans TaxID=31138 RepID=UPI001556278D|nr:RNA/RNP complex-1-interacting phosphatase [Trachemys scripta elegans]